MLYDRHRFTPPTSALPLHLRSSKSLRHFAARLVFEDALNTRSNLRHGCFRQPPHRIHASARTPAMNGQDRDLLWHSAAWLL